jgi:hypothetical protein
MKKLYYYLFLLTILAFSCSKDGMFNNDLGIDQQLNKSFVTSSGSVIKVFPNGTDDTKAILDAFDQAKAAGSGSVVQLAAGTFKIGFIEVWDFEGSFRGAGKGKTIIRNLPDLPSMDLWNKSKYPSLLKFVAGNLFMSDMTIHLNDGPCTPVLDPLGGDLYCTLFLTDNSIDHIPSNRYIKAAVDNVDFIAGYDGGTAGFSPFGGTTMYNVWSSVMVAADNNLAGLTPKGDISITHCKMENDVFGTWIWSLDNGSSANIENNLFTGGSLQILLAGIFGSEIKIRNNQFQKGSLTDLLIDNWNWFYTSPDFTLTRQSHFTMTGNNFHSPQGVTSLVMNDSRRPIFPNEGFPQLFDVMGNNFNTQDGGMAIQSLNNVGARIWNNNFSGTGAMGVSIDGDAPTSTYAEYINLIGNSFFTATYTDASVYLGPYSRNCKVVGVNADKVVNNGVNNSVIGVKPHRGFEHSGQHPVHDFSSIREKLMLIGKH